MGLIGFADGGGHTHGSLQCPSCGSCFVISEEEMDDQLEEDKGVTCTACMRKFKPELDGDLSGSRSSSRGADLDDIVILRSDKNPDAEGNQEDFDDLAKKLGG